MPLFSEHDEFYNEPVTLSEVEKEKPMNVLTEFFSKKSMSEVRQTFEDLRDTCLTTDIGPFKDAEGRSKLISDCKDIEKALDAALKLTRNYQFHDDIMNYE